MRFCVISFEERSLMLAGKSQLYGVMVCREKENRLFHTGLDMEEFLVISFTHCHS